jgi:hypothetical protein
MRRQPPDNSDWTRRYLRRLRIPCEGDQLQAALDALDTEQYQRLKAAWRKHQEREYGSRAWACGRAYSSNRQLGPIWQRLITWGVLTEGDAHALASQTLPGSSNPLHYSDSGAKCVLMDLFRQAAADVRRQQRKTLGAVAAARKVAVQEGADPVAERVVALLEGIIPRAEVLRGLAELEALDRPAGEDA